MSENWRSVAGLEGLYEVSDLGSVRSLDRIVRYPDGRRSYLKPGRILRTSFNKDDGYFHVALYRDGKCCYRGLVHVLVLETFVGPRPPGLEARHLNGHGADNRLTNLAWGTSSENTHDLVRHGRHNNARKTHCKHGHEFTAANTYQHSRGGRQCRECHRRAGRNYQRPSRARKAVA